MKKITATLALFMITFGAISQNVGIGTIVPLYPLHVIFPVASSTGVFENSNSAGDAVTGYNSASAGTAQGSGVVGITSQVNLLAAGVFAQNGNTTGTGIISGGNGGAVKALTAGSGGAFNGTSNGLVGFASATSGTGVIGAGNNATPLTLTAGSGGAFTGGPTGVYANTLSLSGGTNQSVYTYNTQTATAVAINAWNGVQQFKILGNGAVSTIVKDLRNKQVIMYAPESPENYFQDFGEAELINGRVHITIEPILVKNITINERHPLRVFIQPEGDCKGVYVTNKTATGFDVVELNGGNSDTHFQWSITCNRADEQLANGLVSKNADARFSPMPELPKATEAIVTTGAGRRHH